MAKIDKSLLNISGKIGDVVVTKGGRYAKHIRKTVKAGSKMHEDALKLQYSRTAFLNSLASQINSVIHSIAGILKPSDFYTRLLSMMRSEPLNKRLLLLHLLNGMELRPLQPLSNHTMPVLTVLPSAKMFIVNLNVPSHPDTKKLKDCDCYSFEVSVIMWMQNDDDLHKDTLYSEWVYPKKKLPSFTFSFSRPKNALHWLVAVRIRLGYRDEAIESFAADAMRLADAGSFDKRELLWLNKLKTERNTALSKQKKVQIVKRIRANDD